LHEGQLTGMNATDERQRWFTGEDLTLALGCAWPQLSHPRSLHKITTARRPVHRYSRHGVAQSARHDGASRCSPRLDRTQAAKRRFTHGSVQHGSIGLLWCEATSKVARFDSRSWGNDDERRSAARRSAPKQQRTRKGGTRSRERRRSNWGDGVGVAGLVKTAQRRHSRRRSASYSARRRRPPCTATAPAPFNHGQTLVLVHRRCRGAWLPLLPPLLSPTSPFLSLGGSGT
jgi:hypothetical protein